MILREEGYPTKVYLLFFDSMEQIFLRSSVLRVKAET